MIVGGALILVTILLIGIILISVEKTENQNNIYIENTLNNNYISYHPQNMQNQASAPWNVQVLRTNCQKIR